MASISLQGVSKSFGSIQALRDMTVEVKDGEFFVMLGPSGAGKTTLLRTVAGLEQPDQGRVLIGGQDVTTHPPSNRDCAFVFQQYSLYPHLTVYDNIAFPLRSPMRKHAEDDIKKRVNEVAQMLHIESKLQRKATALSGGEMQRVAIGRALVRRPKVFLMDEPLSSLDAKLREELRVELRRIQRSTGSTVIYVTHDQVEATTMADRIAIIEEGRIQQVGTPQQVYTDPNNLAAAQRLGSPVVNVLPADWFQGHTSPRVTHVAIRPEDVEVDLAADSNGFHVIESSLVKHLVVAERTGVEVRAKYSSDHPLPIGQRIALKFPLNRCFYFDSAGNRVATS
jgi:multiple sugar transport system ATP-binding protein